MSGIDYTQWEFDKKTLGYKRPQNLIQPAGSPKNPDIASLPAGQDEDAGYYIMKGDQRIALPAGKSSSVDSEIQKEITPADIYAASKSNPKPLSRGQKIFFASVITTCLLIAISLSILMSQGLNLGHLIGKLFRVDTGEVKYYAVITSEHATKAEAEAAAMTVRQQGGAGYIIYDQNYLVAAALYPDEQSANKVAGQIDGYEATVYTVNISAAKFDLTDKEAAAAAKEALAVFQNTYSNLYDISIELDTGSLTLSGALTKINNLSNANKQKAQAFSEAMASQNKILEIRLTSALNNLENKLAALAVSADDSVKLSTAIKYLCFEIVFDYAALNNELSAL